VALLVGVALHACAAGRERASIHCAPGSLDPGGELVCVSPGPVVTTGAPGPWWLVAKSKETGDMFSHRVEDEETCLLFLQSLRDPRVAQG